jgi:hypothetical protein
VEATLSQASTFIHRTAILAALAAALSGPSAIARPHTVPSSGTLTLRVYDYFHLDRKSLLAAESEATAILLRTSVHVDWVDCPTSHASIDKFPDCQGPAQQNDYILSILSGVMTAQLQKPDDAMGIADESLHGSRRAAVFFNRIDSVAGGDAAPTEVLLGRVMAHEIGHLLLGPNAHSSAGIMQGAWTSRQLSMQAAREMVFTAKQSRIIQARLALPSAATLTTATCGQ